jgi:magnesium-transporting ATPase (P-type)
MKKKLADRFRDLIYLWIIFITLTLTIGLMLFFSTTVILELKDWLVIGGIGLVLLVPLVIFTIKVFTKGIFEETTSQPL